MEKVRTRHCGEKFLINYKPASVQELLTMPVNLLLGSYQSHLCKQLSSFDKGLYLIILPDEA